ncbi:MAG: hypothetical protein ABEJ92_04370 [Halobacteriales archaeon]
MSEDDPLADPVEEAKRVVEAADDRGLTVRQIGGTAIRVHTETAAEPPFDREYRDVDFVATREEENAVEDLMTELGYEANQRFNTMRRYRLEFHDPVNDRKADYVIDRFEFCHQWSLRGRLGEDYPTVPIEDLLLSKLQIIEPSDRDVRDIVAMLAEHPVERSDDVEHVDPDYVADLTRTDWGLYKTLSLTMERVESYLQGNDLPVDEAAVADRIDDLRRAIEERPKSWRWKLRSLIGERKQWYRQPELE